VKWLQHGVSPKNETICTDAVVVILKNIFNKLLELVMHFLGLVSALGRLTQLGGGEVLP